MSTNAFTYDINSKTFDFATNLNSGTNTLIVKAVNTYGTDSKTIAVNYSAPVKVKFPPVSYHH